MQVQQRLIRAMQNYQMGDLGKAEKELKDLQRQFPKSDQIHAMLGAVTFAQKRYKEAFRAYREALKINPRNEEAAVGIGSVEKARGNMPNAIKLLQDATRKFPQRPDAHYNLATIYLEKNDFKKAEGSFQASLRVEPNLIQSHLNLVNIYKNWDDMEKAEYHLRAAITINPDPALKAKLEELIALRGEDAKLVEYAAAPAPKSTPASEQEEKPLWESLGIAANDVNKLVTTAQGFIEKVQYESAEKLLQQVLSLEPENSAAKLGLRHIKSTRIPMWHFEMLADVTRNDAYQHAIERALAKQPGARVLDIGTGSGLLAMMAMRAGASEVLACEMNKDLADAATGIVKDNGYADQITVLNKKSNDLVKGTDFEKPYDLVVSEILDVGGLGEWVLPTLRHAREKLLKKDAVTIPAGITMYAQLVEAPALARVNPVKKISGFDLSGFDQFRPTAKYIQIWIDKEEHTTLTEVFNFQKFDFYNLPKVYTEAKPMTEKLTVKATADGTAQAVVFWFELHLDEEATLSSGPGGELKHWGQAVCYLEEPLTVSAGDELSVKLVMTDEKLWFENA